MASKTTRWAHAAVGISIAAVFLWLSVRKVDAGELRACIRDADWVYLVPILVTIALFFWLKAVRWKLLLVWKPGCGASEKHCVHRAASAHFPGNCPLQPR